MTFDWRTSAIAAGAAFILSLLVGGVGGVAFGALILRAVIGAVVFGVGAAVVSLIIDRYLPDLKQSLSAPGGGESEEPPGSRVDIVVDDEEGPDGAPEADFELEEAEEPGELGDAAPADEWEPEREAEWQPEEPPGTQPAGDAQAGERQPEAGHADERSVEERPTREGPADGGPTETADAPEFTPGIQAERVHEATPEGERSGAAEELEEVPPETAEDTPEVASAGSLPDIEGFSGSFAESSEVDEAEESGNAGEDASTMARAIRTVLKREE
jgi:hypothetical protein